MQTSDEEGPLFPGKKGNRPSFSLRENAKCLTTAAAAAVECRMGPKAQTALKCRQKGDEGAFYREIAPSADVVASKRPLRSVSLSLFNTQGGRMMYTSFREVSLIWEAKYSSRNEVYLGPNPACDIDSEHENANLHESSVQVHNLRVVNTL